MGIFSSMFSGRKQRLAMIEQQRQAQAQIAAQEAQYNAQLQAQKDMTTQMVETLKQTKAPEAGATAPMQAQEGDLQSESNGDAGNIALLAKKKGRNALRIDKAVGGASGGSGLNIAN